MDFKAKYNRTNFTEFFRDKLLPEDFQLNTESIVPDFKSNYFKEITFLGKSRSLDLNVYEIRHTSEKDARVGLSRDAFKLVSRFNENNALILFIPDNPANFRLSLVTIDPKLDAHGVKVLKEYSNPRRYSFVLGEDAKTHTPEQYLIGQGRITDITDLKKRFSVELVNKEFYGQIAEMFSKLVGGKRKKGNRTIEYQRTLVLPSVGAADDQKFKEFAVRLIGRTVFCWFLKKKKSDKGIPLIGNDVLSVFEAGFTTNFYHARVEPLFFEVLNTAIDKRKPEYQKEPFRSIPFLNGGLFEPHLDDFYVNGTPNYALKIPDEWWREFLTILETYNFTIDENTSIDIDLSVDPEMLGRIFENLLAEINPETGETARKTTGSYYTPRPIVEYMVDQSLKQYLITKTNIDSAKLDILLDYSNELSGLVESEEKQVLEAINNIKVLDPACGSGAFPMGVLQKMLLVLQKVDHGAESSMAQVLNDIKDPTYREIIKQKLQEAQVLNSANINNYTQKLSIIQKSIFGVDIQPIATDISKLRFFLSLVVDEVINDAKPNRDIQPLPNLEFKFVCANTLMPAPKNDAIETYAKSAFEKLGELTSKYFTAIDDEKIALIKDIKSCINEILDANEKVVKQWIEKINQNRNSATPAKLKQMNEAQRVYIKDLNTWSSYKNLFNDKPIDFFEPKYFFPTVKNGFDIVIGNPPYGIEFNEDQKLFLKTKYDHLVQRIRNSYLYFTGKAYDLLNDNGVLSYIIPNEFLFQIYMEKARTFFLENAEFKIAINAGEEVFQAIVPSCIIVVKKNKKNEYPIFLKDLRNCDLLEISHKLKANNCIEVLNTQILRSPNSIFSFNSEKSGLVNEIISKAKPFDTYCDDVANGISTSCDSVYIVDKSFAKEHNFEKDFIKPSIRGTHFNQFFCPDTSEEMVLYVNADFDPKKAPNIYNYLKQHKDLLIQKSVEKKTGIREWHILFRAREESLFESPKIIIRQTADRIIAAIDEDKNFYCIDSVNIAKLNSTNIALSKFLIGILNSQLSKFIYQEISQESGRVLAQVKPIRIKQIPIIEPHKNDLPIFDKVVSELINLKREDANCNPLYKVLNLMIYKLYRLSYENCKIVDPEIERMISCNDYERLDIEGLSKYEIK